MKLAKRIVALERRLITEPTTLFMPDGKVVILPGRGDHLVNLLGVVIGGATSQQEKNLDLIRRSVGSSEPGGGHLVDLTRALLLSPGGTEESGEVLLEAQKTKLACIANWKE